MSSDKTERRENKIGSAFQEEEVGTISDMDLVRRLWSYMRPYRATFFGCLLLLPLLLTGDNSVYQRLQIDSPPSP